MSRTSAIYLHIGAKQTGKTQGSLDMMADFLIKQHKRVLIFDINNQEEYDKFRPIKLVEIPYWRTLEVACCREATDINLFFDIVHQYVRNAVIVCEDSTSYMQGNLSESKQRVILNSRNANNDFIFNLHSLSRPAPFLYANSEYIILRRTSDPWKLHPKIPNPEAVYQARMEIVKENKELHSTTDYKLAYRLIDLNA